MVGCLGQDIPLQSIHLEGRYKCQKIKAVKKRKSLRKLGLRQMPSTKKRPDFYNTDEGKEIKKILELMESDKAYNTKSAYSTDGGKYPSHRMPFVDKHMRYLSEHSAVSLKHYISNLKLITRVR